MGGVNRAHGIHEMHNTKFKAEKLKDIDHWEIYE
jgi:hypothetical protein